jgi:hypothetical protein
MAHSDDTHANLPNRGLALETTRQAKKQECSRIRGRAAPGRKNVGAAIAQSGTVIIASLPKHTSTGRITQKGRYRASRARSASFALTYPVRVRRVGITGAALSAVPKRLEGFDQTVVRQRNGHSGQTMRTVLIVGSVMCIHVSQRTSKFRCACRRFEDLQRRCQYVST